LARIRLSLAAAVLALALPAAAHAATYTVSVGSPPTAHVPGAFAAGLFEGDGFYPGGLQIHRGDSVKFVGGFHTATILGGAKRAPLELVQPDPAHGVYTGIKDAGGASFYFNGLGKFIYNPATFAPTGGGVVNSKTKLYSSGALFLSPKGYTLRFSKVGTYRVICLIHPYMSTRIIVRKRGVAIPTKRAQSRRAAAQLAVDVNNAKKADLRLARAVQDPKSAVVSVGGGNSRRFSLFAFYPSALSVKVGTTVTFRNQSPNEPHNVGIGDVNYQLGVFLAANDLFPTGPGSPNQVNPALLYGTDPAVGGLRTYAGASSHTNGFFATNAVWQNPNAPLPRETKVRFTAAGTYTYICQIHPFMVGTINVHP
jgi:plastocyanin